MTRTQRAIQLVLAVLIISLFGYALARAEPAESHELPASKAQMNALIDQTNFAVGNPTFCSATLIHADKGILLTANHCIDQQFETVEREKIGYDGTVKIEKVRVAKPGIVSQLVFKDGDVVIRTDYTFKIIQNDADMDVALIQVKGKLPTSSPAPIACKQSERGDEVYAVGNPYGVLYASLTKGIVSSTERGSRMLHIDQGKDTQFIQFSAPIIGGNSGGALYNEFGELEGVVVRGGAPGFGLAVPLSDVKKILSSEMLEDLWKRCK